METTVEDITDAADVGKGTFFNYFPTKEHVLATLGAERVATVERALQKAKRGSVLPALEELATDLAGQSSSSAALLRAIYAAHASCAPVRAELHKRLSIARRLLAEIFRLGTEEWRDPARPLRRGARAANANALVRAYAGLVAAP